jgi:hypothetical protein
MRSGISISEEIGDFLACESMNDRRKARLDRKVKDFIKKFILDEINPTLDDEHNVTLSKVVPLVGDGVSYDAYVVISGRPGCLSCSDCREIKATLKEYGETIDWIRRVHVYNSRAEEMGS